MKNKEIENILDKCAPYLFRDELDKLLSYIEQLEKTIYKARKMIFDNYGVLDKYEIEMLDDILKGDSDYE